MILSFGSNLALGIQVGKDNRSVKLNHIGNGYGFKENEDLGDIIKAHRQALKDIQVLETTVKSQKQKLVELFNEVQALSTKVSTLATRVNKSRSKDTSLEGEHN